MMVLNDAEIRAYLAAALDQVACKDTLRSALVSRVDSLVSRGISTNTICRNMRYMCEDPYQINDDIILEVISQMRTNAEV